MATNGIPFEKNMTLCLISQEGDAAPFTAIEFIYPNSFLLNNNMWYSDVKMPSWVTAHIVSHDNIAWDDSDTVVLRLITAPKEVLDFPAVEILKYGEIVCYVERIYSGVKFSVEYECIAWAECNLEYPTPEDAAAIQSAGSSVPAGSPVDVAAMKRELELMTLNSEYSAEIGSLKSTMVDMLTQEEAGKLVAEIARLTAELAAVRAERDALERQVAAIRKQDAEDLVDIVTGYVERNGRPDSDDDLLTAVTERTDYSDDDLLTIEEVRRQLGDPEFRHIGD